MYVRLKICLHVISYTYEYNVHYTTFEKICNIFALGLQILLNFKYNIAVLSRNRLSLKIC